MYCSMFTTKYLISILHYTVDPGYTFCLPPHPSPSGNRYSVLYIYMFWVFFVFFIWFVHLFF